MSFYFSKNIITGGGSFLGTPDTYGIVVINPNLSYKYISRVQSGVVINSHSDGEVINYSFDFGREEKRRGAGVSSVSWSSSGGCAVVGAPYLSGSLSVCSLSIGSGKSIVTVSCLFDDGSIKKENIEILGKDKGAI